MMNQSFNIPSFDLTRPEDFERFADDESLKTLGNEEAHELYNSVIRTIRFHAFDPSSTELMQQKSFLTDLEQRLSRIILNDIN